MIRSILIGLDHSPSGIAAQELAVRWAKRHDARLTGLAIVDNPGIPTEALASLNDAGHLRAGNATATAARPRTTEALEQSVRGFHARCGECGVEARILKEVGAPHLQILAEAPRHDLILLGRASRFAEGWEGEPGQTLELVLHGSPRPVVAVPEAPAEGEAVVIAYDGSLQASRALAAFETSGLGLGADVHLVSAAVDRRDAARHAERAQAFLASHEIEATPHVVETPVAPADVILKTVRETRAGLLVMGAYGLPVLREFFLGSITRSLLETCPVPLFLFH